MAEGVEVHVTDRAIISACNTPGGPVFEWRDMIGKEVTIHAMSISPINDVLNAQHRGGVVGEFIRSWGWDRVGSNGHTVRATVYNGADHAVYVEEGRSESRKWQTFSWSRWGGGVQTTDYTGPRPGKHVLRRALVAVMGSQGLSA